MKIGVGAYLMKEFRNGLDWIEEQFSSGRWMLGFVWPSRAPTSS